MLTLLEHLNFKVPMANGKRLIEDFFVNRLGCPECPTGRLRVCAPVRGQVPEGEQKQMHVNLGLSQIHFEWCTGDGREYSVPQRLEGFVTLQFRDMDKLRDSLKGIPFTELTSGRLAVVDPFGLTTWVCEQATADDLRLVERFGSVRPGGVGNAVGIKRVDYNCQPGMSGSIVQFYSQAFKAPVSRSTTTGTSSEIHTRFGQTIAWNETLAAPPPNAYEYGSGLWSIHMCFYIENFAQHANNLQKLFWINPDYRGPPINDAVDTVDKALKSKQFRIKHIGDYYVLEHEIRATDHPLSPLKDYQSKL